MADPVWEILYQVSSVRVDVEFDFNMYNYRATTISDFQSTVYKDNTQSNSAVFVAPVGSYIDLHEGMTIYGSKFLTQGSNMLTTSNAAYSIQIERSLKWSPPNFQPKIGGTIRETEMAWVKVDGQLRELDKVWTKVNGVVREV